MPRDTAHWQQDAPDAEDDSAETGMHAAERVTANACYVCGAWSDDPSRCRFPDSSACVQRRGDG